MRCTKCSTQIKPVVAIDIDGTLADYHSHFLRFAVAYLGLMEFEWQGEVLDFHPGLVEYDGSAGFRLWFQEAFGIDQRTWNDIKLAYRQGGMKRSAPAYPDVTAPIHAAREGGAEIWLTTTRPYLRLDGIDPDTRFWLKKKGVEFDGLLYDEDKYGVLAERVEPERVVMVLDDLPEQYDAAVEAFGEVAVLRRQHYNRGVKRPVLHSSLATAADDLRVRITDWEAKHEA